MLILLCCLVKTNITFVAGFGDLSLCQSSQYGAALFLSVGTAYKFTLAQIGVELPKGKGQFLFVEQFGHLRVKTGEARRVRYQRPIGQAEQFNVTGGVATTAQLFADFAGRCV